MTRSRIPSKARGGSQPSAEPQQVHDLVQALQQVDSVDRAPLHLEEISDRIGTDRVSWNPDLSRPFFNPPVDAFLKRQRWPQELIDIWWQHHMTIKMPFFIRCRLEHVPFVTDVENNGLGPDKGSAKQRRIVEIMLELGMRSMLTVPLHLPKGQIAMVTWCSLEPAKTLAGLIPQCGAQLLAAGHYFMHFYNSARSFAPEEVSRLTPREWECVRLAAQGMTENEVARTVEISPTTVRYHLDNVVRKLGCSNRVHAIARAAQLGMIGPIGS